MPAPFVPSSASTSPCWTSKPTLNSTWTVAVGEVDVVDLDRRDVLGVDLLAFVLGELVAQFGDDE